jgi:hypothetical protein
VDGALPGAPNAPQHSEAMVTIAGHGIESPEFLNPLL